MNMSVINIHLKWEQFYFFEFLYKYNDCIFHLILQMWSCSYWYYCLPEPFKHYFFISIYNADAHLALPFVIPSPMEDPFGRWFLARSADGKRLMIIHEDRYIRSNDHLEPAEVLHDGNGLIQRECPAPVIHIFEKDLSLIGPHWSRVDSLGTHFLFIGLNYPMNLKINDGNAERTFHDP